MNFKTTEIFDKDFKKLYKKYRNIKNDFLNFVEHFQAEHQHSKVIKKNVFKARIANSDKHKGKRAGYRTYYYKMIDDEVIFLVIYDKSEHEAIDETLLDDLIKNLP